MKIKDLFTGYHIGYVVLGSMISTITTIYLMSNSCNIL